MFSDTEYGPPMNTPEQQTRAARKAEQRQMDVHLSWKQLSPELQTNISLQAKLLGKSCAEFHAELVGLGVEVFRSEHQRAVI